MLVSNSFLVSSVQVLCLTEQVMFTDRCETAISSNSLQEFMIEMESQLESYTNTEIGKYEWNEIQHRSIMNSFSLSLISLS